MIKSNEIPATAPHPWRMVHFEWFAIPLACLWCALFCGASWLIMHRTGDLWFAAMFVAVGAFPFLRLPFLKTVVLEIEPTTNTFRYSSGVWWRRSNVTHTFDIAAIASVVYHKEIRTTGDESSATARLLIRQQDGTDHTLFPYGIVNRQHESAHHRGRLEWVPAGNGPLRLAKAGRTIAAALGVPYLEEELHC